jgi:hypothetical protein
MTDPWEAFGSDDDDDDADDTADVSITEEGTPLSSTTTVVVSCLAQRLLLHRCTLSTSKILLLLVVDHGKKGDGGDDGRDGDEGDRAAATISRAWKSALRVKQVTDVTVWSVERETGAVAKPDEAVGSARRDVSAGSHSRCCFDACIVVVGTAAAAAAAPDRTNRSATAADDDDVTMTAALRSASVLFCLFYSCQPHKNENASSTSDVTTTNIYEALYNTSRQENDESIVETVHTVTDTGVLWKAVDTSLDQIRIQSETCLWLPSRHRTNECHLLRQAAVLLSCSERASGIMSTASIRLAVRNVRDFGYCVMLGLLESERHRCIQFGDAILNDLHLAATILKEQHGVDLYGRGRSTTSNNNNNNGTEGEEAPGAYYEMSMREDFRMDLRRGPRLRKIQGDRRNNAPVTIKAHQQEVPDEFLRGNRNVLEIVRTVMNPTYSVELSGGNYGRYNFDSRGGGADGSFQDLTVGTVGGIVSLPGAADQAIHADTFHLFEHLPPSAPPLPPHYVNLFTPGRTPAHGVGQTAFVHGSHRLDFVARHCSPKQHDGSSLEQFDRAMWEFLVRPRLELGDVLLFDCRILHFGLSNTHKTIERPVLYINMTMHWFHDPKNWDRNRRIFPKEDEEDD